MDSQEERPSYEQLMSRIELYKKKSLDLEEKLVTAGEMVEHLEKELKAVAAEKERELQQSKTEMQEFYSKLVGKGSTDYEAKIADYEELIGKMQEEAAEKDQKIEAYMEQIKNLEEQLSLHKKVDPSITSSVNDSSSKSGKTINEYSSIAYFNYAVIFYGKKTGYIKASLCMENTGIQPLENPYICLRFHPSNAANIKGNIIFEKKRETSDQSSSSYDWVFVDNEWAAKARERGEVWICLSDEMKVLPGESVLINDYKIPLKKNVCDNVRVEAFVFYNQKQFKIKAVNQISIHLKPYCLKCISKNVYIDKKN